MAPPGLVESVSRAVYQSMATGSLARDGPQVSSPQSGSERANSLVPHPEAISAMRSLKRLPMLAGLEAVVPRLEIAHRV